MLSLLGTLELLGMLALLAFLLLLALYSYLHESTLIGTCRTHMGAALVWTFFISHMVGTERCNRGDHAVTGLLQYAPWIRP